jgi:hypothetical protein
MRRNSPRQPIYANFLPKRVRLTASTACGWHLRSHTTHKDADTPEKGQGGWKWKPRSSARCRYTRSAREARHTERLDRRPAFDRLDAIRKPVEAELARRESERLLTPPEALVGSAARSNGGKK